MQAIFTTNPGICCDFTVLWLGRVGLQAIFTTNPGIGCDFTGLCLGRVGLQAICQESSCKRHCCHSLAGFQGGMLKQLLNTRSSLHHSGTPIPPLFRAGKKKKKKRDATPPFPSSVRVRHEAPGGDLPAHRRGRVRHKGGPGAPGQAPGAAPWLRHRAPRSARSWPSRRGGGGEDLAVERNPKPKKEREPAWRSGVFEDFIYVGPDPVS